VVNYEQRINLWGSPGCGKTFLGHYLHLNRDFSYFQSIETYRGSENPKINSVTIVDSAPHERKQARVIFGDVSWKSDNNVILITREPINDAVRRISLSLTDEDLKQILDTFEQILNVKIMEALDNNIQQSGIWALLEHAVVM